MLIKSNIKTVIKAMARLALLLLQKGGLWVRAKVNVPMWDSQNGFAEKCAVG
jgi:hypothetical protein